MLPMIVVLAIPIVPFVLFGPQLEAALQAWQQHPPAAWLVALAVIALLATDIFLPIPSSLVSTLAGWQLGALGGALAAWTGMSLGAIIGFALAKRWGQPLVAWLTRKVDLHGLSWRAFLPPVLLANLGLAIAYAVFGKVAAEYQWLPLALAVSIALPVLMVAGFRTLVKEPQPARRREPIE